MLNRVQTTFCNRFDVVPISAFFYKPVLFKTFFRHIFIQFIRFLQTTGNRKCVFRFICWTFFPKGLGAMQGSDQNQNFISFQKLKPNSAKYILQLHRGRFSLSSFETQSCLPKQSRLQKEYTYPASCSLAVCSTPLNNNKSHQQHQVLLFCN